MRKICVDTDGLRDGSMSGADISLMIIMTAGGGGDIKKLTATAPKVQT